MSDISWTVEGVFINANDLLAIALGVAFVIVGHFILRHTTLGISLRAAAEDADIAQSAGISVPALRTWTWALSGLLVSVAGHDVCQPTFRQLFLHDALGHQRLHCRDDRWP